MNFSQLKSIVKNIKTHVTCPKCGGNYMSEDLHVISSIGNKCLVVAKCRDCNTPILVTAVIKHEHDPEHREIVTEEQSIIELPDDVITSDDVVNVHEILSSYDGDIRNLFDSN